MPTLVKVTCEKCQIEFDKPIGKVNEANKRGASHYCSRKCFHSGRKTWKVKGNKLEVECFNCDVKFFKHQNQLSLTEKDFCSLQCAGAYRTKQPLNLEIRYKFNCKICNSENYLIKHDLEQRLKQNPSGNLFCSRSCFYMFMKDHVKNIKGCTRSLLEKYIEKKLQELYPTLDCLYNQKYKGYEFDLRIPSLNLAIEFNGPCHYLPEIYGEDKLRIKQQRDEERVKICLNDMINFYIIKNFGNNRNIVVLNTHLKEVVEIIDNAIKIGSQGIAP